MIVSPPSSGAMMGPRRGPVQTYQLTLGTPLMRSGMSEAAARPRWRLAYADEGAPGGREPGADQNIVRMIAEHAAVFAHPGAERADFMIARGIEQCRQDSQGGGDIVHRRLAIRSSSARRSHR